MTPAFTVQTSPRFERLARRLRRQHREFTALLREAFDILETDPYNHSRRHAIKKLTGAQEDGQWRLRIGRFRFRYDIAGETVELKYCGLRREDTYR
jgi:mRNA-degrading endonuclease RelE of RelBE toxin-antitoxin system